MRFVGLDPSTKTGYVALSESGVTLEAKELTGVGSADPLRMITMIDEIMLHIKKDDFVTIENFAFSADGRYSIQLGGIGWAIRMALMRRGIKYYDIAPGQLKKFITGNGSSKKPAIVKPLHELYGFKHPSDNTRDAYVLAQIGKSMVTKKVKNKKQLEVIEKVFQTINETGK